MRDVVRNRRAVLLAGPAALLLAAAAACSSSGTSTTSTSSTAATTAGSGSSSSAPGSTSADALVVTTNSTLGQIITTGSGRTVYRFDVDSANPSKSNCTGTCSSLWPPVLATGSGTPAVAGVSSSLVGELTRSDGSKQLTVGGWPIYTYAGDTGSGTAMGEGSGGTWWAVSPAGARVKSGAGATTSTTTSGNGGGNY